jgi:hypothetical protein
MPTAARSSLRVSLLSVRFAMMVALETMPLRAASMMPRFLSGSVL